MHVDPSELADGLEDDSRLLLQHQVDRLGGERDEIRQASVIDFPPFGGPVRTCDPLQARSALPPGAGLPRSSSTACIPLLDQGSMVLRASSCAAMLDAGSMANRPLELGHERLLVASPCCRRSKAHAQRAPARPRSASGARPGRKAAIARRASWLAKLIHFQRLRRNRLPASALRRPGSYRPLRALREAACGGVDRRASDTSKTRPPPRPSDSGRIGGMLRV